MQQLSVYKKYFLAIKLRKNTHTAQECKIGSPLEDVKIEETFSANAMKVNGD